MRIALASLFLFVSFGLLAGTKIYVPFFSAENCSQQTATAATYVFAEYLNSFGVYEAELAQKRDSAGMIESINDMRESAELLGTNFFVVGKLFRIESQYVISINLYTSSGNVSAWSDIRRFSDLNELPIVLEYLASHLGNDKKMSQKGDVFLTHGQEVEGVKRKKSNRQTGLFVGTYEPFQKEFNELTTGLGLFGSIDNRNFIFQFGMSYYHGEDSIIMPEVDPAFNGPYEFENNYFNITISVLYPLSSTNNAPFVAMGTGFSYRGTQSRYGNWQDYGSMFSAGGGYILGRNSDASLFIDIRGFAYIPDVNRIEAGGMLSFGVGF